MKLNAALLFVLSTFAFNNAVAESEFIHMNCRDELSRSVYTNKSYHTMLLCS